MYNSPTKSSFSFDNAIECRNAEIPPRERLVGGPVVANCVRQGLIPRYKCIGDSANYLQPAIGRCANRMGDAAPPACAEAPEEGEAEPEAPEFAFHDDQHTLVVDLGGLCAIPFDAEASAIESLRAFQFEKGKAMHGPHAGTYAVAGMQKTLTTLMRVHFREATKRKSELLVSFADYGMASNAATGIYVCSLQLPLMKRKNVYENTIRYTRIADVVGFSSINERQAPWSIHLKPALQKLGSAHANFKLFTSGEVAAFMQRPLTERISELHELAKQSLSFHLEGLRRQDKALAEKQSAQFEAQLQNTVDFLLQLPASNYDKPLSERLIIVSADGEAQVQESWVTPSKASSVLAAEVQADGLARTAKRKASVPARAVQAPDQRCVSPESSLEADDDRQICGGEEAHEPESCEGYSLKRARKKPMHFEFTRNPKKKGAAKAKEQTDINPRTGKPYQRGPYDKDRKQGAGAVLASAAKSIPPSNAGTVVDRSTDRETISKLKARVAELEGELKKVEAELKSEKIARDLHVSNARLEVRESMSGELLVKYQQGLQDGANLSHGKATLFGFKVGGITSPDCSASGSSLSRFSSN